METPALRAMSATVILRAILNIIPLALPLALTGLYSGIRPCQSLFTISFNNGLDLAIFWGVFSEKEKTLLQQLPDPVVIGLDRTAVAARHAQPLKRDSRQVERAREELIGDAQKLGSQAEEAPGDQGLVPKQRSGGR
jgi:hypothetical protein